MITVARPEQVDWSRNSNRENSPDNCGDPQQVTDDCFAPIEVDQTINTRPDEYDAQQKQAVSGKGVDVLFNRSRHSKRYPYQS